MHIKVKTGRAAWARPGTARPVLGNARTGPGVPLPRPGPVQNFASQKKFCNPTSYRQSKQLNLHLIPNLFDHKITNDTSHLVTWFRVADGAHDRILRGHGW